MGKICRNKDGKFVIFRDSAEPSHLKREICIVERGEYNNYYNDYEEIRQWTGEFVDEGIWWFINGGAEIDDENVPEKYKDMTYESEPRTI